MVAQGTCLCYGSGYQYIFARRAFHRTLAATRLLTVYTERLCMCQRSSIYSYVFQLFLFCFFSRGKEAKPGSRGGSARVPVAEASPCAPRKGRAVAAKRPPGGERSVCGMSGRPIAAAPYVFAEFIRIPHTDHVRTPHDGFSCEHQADRTKSRHRRRCPLSRSRRSAREGTWGRRNAPRSHNTGSFIFRRRVFANPSSSVAQTVEEPVLRGKRAK